MDSADTLLAGILSANTSEKTLREGDAMMNEDMSDYLNHYIECATIFADFYF